MLRLHEKEKVLLLAHVVVVAVAVFDVDVAMVLVLEVVGWEVVDVVAVAVICLPTDLLILVVSL